MFLSDSETAQTGYYIAEMQLTVYSLEELVYAVCQKGFLLGENFACEELAEWLHTQCCCTDLAYRLAQSVQKKEGLISCVVTILRYAGYVSEKEIDRVRESLSAGEKWSYLEKRKKEGDIYLEELKYDQALSAYQKLLSELPEGEVKLKASLWHNIGVAQAKLFLFDAAMESFSESYQLIADEDTFFQWLTCARIVLPNREYLDYLGENPEVTEQSLRLEEQINRLTGALKHSAQGEELEKLKEWLTYGSEEGVYLASGRLLKALMKDYRQYIAGDLPAQSIT
ncbi:MAG: hypothetical protein LUG61_05655 [Lachnospiraceae bacterium]|nr:hypothetical protein [Lachnospiraceae bacterium]